MEWWRLLYEDNFKIAFRRRGNDLLPLSPEKTADRPFTIMETGKSTWEADPMIFSRNGTDWLFYESFDKWKDKGLIGVCRLDPELGPVEHRIVLECAWHLSYPFVFESAGQCYMIPETSANRTIECFRAVDFPWQWEPVGILMQDVQAVDTTLLEKDGHIRLFTVFEDKRREGLSLVLFDTGTSPATDKLPITPPVPHPAGVLSRDPAAARSAGRFIELHGTLVRPSQDCSDGQYGRALVFSSVVGLTDSHYSECLMGTISPEMISCRFRPRVLGLHTYALGQDFEIIDVKFHCFYGAFKYLRLLLRQWRRLTSRHASSHGRASAG